MKKLLLFLIILAVFSCREGNNIDKNQKVITELNEYRERALEEERLKQWTRDYIEALNSEGWKTKLPKFLQPNPEEFLQEHSAFRTSFANYRSTIKHLAVDGNDVIVWLNITANYAASYSFENSAYDDNVFNDVEAKNQALSWDETWYFNVVDDKFDDQWDFLKDNHKILQGLKSNESP